MALTWGGGETHYDKSNFKVKMNTATFYFLLSFFCFLQVLNIFAIKSCNFNVSFAVFRYRLDIAFSIRQSQRVVQSKSFDSPYETRYMDVVFTGKLEDNKLFL